MVRGHHPWAANAEACSPCEVASQVAYLVAFRVACLVVGDGLDNQDSRHSLVVHAAGTPLGRGLEVLPEEGQMWT